jgi:hypothetical protein
VNATALVVFGATTEGDTLQVAWSGAPLHASETEPVNPPSGSSCRSYVATWPAVTVIDVGVPFVALNTNSGAATVSTAALELTPLCAAVIFAVPAATPVAIPAMLIVAAAVFEEFHVAVLDKFCVVPSE